MAENSHISWTDHTFNPWIGCTRVSPACDGCYAEALMGPGGRFKRAEWGEPGKGEGTRVRTKDWSKPRKWNREAAAAPGQTFVFCASLADVFDNAVPSEWRRDLFDLIRATPNLTWLLLTKRPGMIVKLWAEAVTGGRATLGVPSDLWPSNAAIGCTVVNQEEADRDIPKLLAAKAALKPAFAFLSMEPLLGPVDLRRVGLRNDFGKEVHLDSLTGERHTGKPSLSDGAHVEPWAPSIDWVITGGETDQGAHRARPTDPGFFRSLRDQCAAAGIPYHHKQNGEWGHCPDRSVLPDHLFKVGKERAGRLLDGVTHDARPEVSF